MPSPASMTGSSSTNNGGGESSGGYTPPMPLNITGLSHRIPRMSSIRELEISKDFDSSIASLMQDINHKSEASLNVDQLLLGSDSDDDYDDDGNDLVAAATAAALRAARLPEQAQNNDGLDSKTQQKNGQDNDTSMCNENDYNGSSAPIFEEEEGQDANGKETKEEDEESSDIEDSFADDENDDDDEENNRNAEQRPQSKQGPHQRRQSTTAFTTKQQQSTPSRRQPLMVWRVVAFFLAFVLSLVTYGSLLHAKDPEYWQQQETLATQVWQDVQQQLASQASLLHVMSASLSVSTTASAMDAQFRAQAHVLLLEQQHQQQQQSASSSAASSSLLETISVAPLLRPWNETENDINLVTTTTSTSVSSSVWKDIISNTSTAANRNSSAYSLFLWQTVPKQQQKPSNVIDLMQQQPQLATDVQQLLLAELQQPQYSSSAIRLSPLIRLPFLESDADHNNAAMGTTKAYWMVPIFDGDYKDAGISSSSSSSIPKIGGIILATFDWQRIVENSLLLALANTDNDDDDEALMIRVKDHQGLDVLFHLQGDEVVVVLGDEEDSDSIVGDELFTEYLNIVGQQGNGDYPVGYTVSIYTASAPASSKLFLWQISNKSDRFEYGILSLGVFVVTVVLLVFYDVCVTRAAVASALARSSMLESPLILDHETNTLIAKTFTPSSTSTGGAMISEQPPPIPKPPSTRKNMSKILSEQSIQILSPSTHHQPANKINTSSFRKHLTRVKSSLHNFLLDNLNETSYSGGLDYLAKTKPIADLFPATTIMFADLVGFTAWSSARDPTQVFRLLETIYFYFDELAKKRRVFKVETVGDCYVAVAGLPAPREDHAVVMARFARDCLLTFYKVVKKLDLELGPDTSDLLLRIGLHSGQTTAGVLRGDRARFQLFGDTVNTASRMESTGKPGMIQLSKETASQLEKFGKEHWVRPREELVYAKGKGELQTYWLEMASVLGASASSTGGSSFNASFHGEGENAEADKMRQVPSQRLKRGFSIEELQMEDVLANEKEKHSRLVDWNTDLLAQLLLKVVARREASRSRGDPLGDIKKTEFDMMRPDNQVLGEVVDVIEMPDYNFVSRRKKDPSMVMLSPVVQAQLRGYVETISFMYRDNPFHNFEHASHVVMSVNKLLGRIVAPDMKFNNSGDMAVALHDHTYGITSDPLTQFTLVLSALIHDVDHTGLPNSQLVSEGTPLASAYNNRSVAEQNSVDLAWTTLMESQFNDLRQIIYHTIDELQRFRRLLVNAVMATDIMDRQLRAQRKARWDKAFDKPTGRPYMEKEDTDRKATIVMEHLIQASDVAHTMQHWHIYRKWNIRLFEEMYSAYCAGRAESDPSENWYQGELNFFDFYIIPLARKLNDCGVFGVSSDECLNYAEMNRNEWAKKGRELVAEMMENLRANNETVRRGLSLKQLSLMRNACDDTQREFALPVRRPSVGRGNLPMEDSFRRNSMDGSDLIGNGNDGSQSLSKENSFRRNSMDASFVRRGSIGPRPAVVGWGGDSSASIGRENSMRRASLDTAMGFQGSVSSRRSITSRRGSLASSAQGSSRRGSLNFGRRSSINGLIGNSSTMLVSSHSQRALGLESSSLHGGKELGGSLHGGSLHRESVHSSRRGSLSKNEDGLGGSLHSRRGSMSKANKALDMLSSHSRHISNHNPISSTDLQCIPSAHSQKSSTHSSTSSNDLQWTPSEHESSRVPRQNPVSCIDVSAADYTIPSGSAAPSTSSEESESAGQIGRGSDHYVRPRRRGGRRPSTLKTKILEDNETIDKKE